MISSASTLLLATLVFNAATVYGAPIRIVDTTSEPIARAEMSTPVQPVVARAPIVDVQDNRRRSQLGHITRRLARLVSERDEPLTEAVVAREPEPVVESREHRYPRRVYHDFYEREPEPVVPAVAPVVESRERRYPRQVYHDFYVKREPATTIKETTKVVEKTTVLDTPADLAAFNAAKASPSGSGVTVSTVTSTSQTTTIAASGSVPTPAPTADPSASPSGDASSTVSASATTSASDSTSTSASPTSTTASGEPTPTAGGDSNEPTPTSSATSSAASGQPTDAPAGGKSGDPKPAVTVDGTTPPDPSAGSSDPTAREYTGGDITEARRGIYVKASTAPILRRLATSGASWASSVRRQLNTH